MDNNERDQQDFYDRMMGSMAMRGDVLRTEVVTRRSSTILGTTETSNIQTFRTEDGDTTFIEHTSARGLSRMVLVPSVTKVIAEQRARLDSKARKRAAAKAVETRKAKQAKGGE